MKANLENPVVLFATTVGGFVLAILLLFLMVGGGFFLALMVLALLPVALAVVALESILGREPAAAAGAVPVPTAAPAWGRPTALGVVAVVALLAFYGGGMTLVQSWAHTVADIGRHSVLLLLVLAGFGALVGLASTFVPRHALSKGGAFLAGIGTGIGILALQSCCIVPLVVRSPLAGLLSDSAVALYVNQMPVAVMGIAANLLGIAWVVAMARQQSQTVAA